MKWMLIFILIALFTSGCDNKKKEAALQEREAALNQKEQQLLLKEKTLQLREENLLKREQQLDSALRTDSGYINQSLVGLWAVKMTCTETTCAGSAIGDTKTEQWDISYVANKLIAKAMDKGNLIRTYTGSFANNRIELVEDRQGTATQPATNMVVRLQMIDETSMEGQREITREGDCKVVYVVEMDKQAQ